MRFGLMTMIQRAAAVLGATGEARPHRFARFDIGVCSACKRLRSAASLRCEHCGSDQAVNVDA